MNIPLGFEVGTGHPVEIPLKHMAIAGQTQEAGKTTALEALITRSKLRALTFITKRGESSFKDSRRIEPYFREQADWQFVASILEASRGEKLRWERAAIITASKGATRLREVHHKIKNALSGKKASRWEKEYICLDAYLDVIVPQIDRVHWAPIIVLQPGVNAMDLTAIPVEMQHLIIKSTIDWVLEHATDTVVVIPEAWKFIPQDRGTPVKLSAESYIRQAAGLKNYLWLDSQDIGGIEKAILRSVPLWVLGVQREANEIKRTLDNIPGGIAKPKKDDVATLGLGQFFICHHTKVIKAYVQPAWLPADLARQVAVGTLDVHAVRPPAIRPPATAVPTRKESPAVNEHEAQQLRDENAQLRAENRNLHARLEALEEKVQHDRQGQVDRGRDSAAGQHRADGTSHQSNAGTGHSEIAQRPTSEGHRTTARPVQAFHADDEARYQAFKARLIEEAPAILKVAASRPEIEMTIQRKTIQLDESSLKGRIAKLLKDGYFSEARGCGAVRGALKRTGPDANTGNIGRALDDFTRDGFVTNEGAGYREVPGMKVNIIEQ